MMKKLILLIVTAIVIFNLAGCESVKQNSLTQTTNMDKPKDSNNMQDDLLEILNSEQEIKNEAINTGKDCDLKLAKSLNDAVIQEDINKLKTEIKIGDKINCIYDDGLKTKSIFAIAIEKNNLEILKYLIEVGGDVNLRNPATKETPLMTAAKFSHSVEMVELLVEKGAEINDADQEGKTALMMAVNSARSVEIIQYLVDKGANIEAKEIRGYTALDIANKQDVIDSMEMMMGREKAVKTAIKMRSTNYQEIVNILHGNS